MNISEKLQEKYHRLTVILKDMENVLVAFSGGVDSTLLLKVARDVLGKKVLAVIATSETCPGHAGSPQSYRKPGDEKL